MSPSWCAKKVSASRCARADGGTEFTNITKVYDFERAALASGKMVETVYYEGGRHNDLFDSSVRYLDAVQRMSAFLLRHLGT
jgi:hypothetical protein